MVFSPLINQLSYLGGPILYSLVAVYGGFLKSGIPRPCVSILIKMTKMSNLDNLRYLHFRKAPYVRQTPV